MAMTIGSLMIRVGANVKPLMKGMKTAGSSLQGFVRKHVSLSKMLKTGAKSVAVLTAAFGALAIVGIRNGGMLSDVSEKLGIASGKLTQFQVRASAAGIEFKQFEMGMQRMTRRVSEAAQGMGEAQGALKELGLDAKELNALSPDKQFALIGEAMRGAASSGDKLRLAMKLFDSEGVNLIRVLNQTNAEVEELNKRSRLMGVTLSDFETGKLDEAADILGQIKLATTGVGNQFGLFLTPFIKEADKALFDFLEESGGIKTILGVGLDGAMGGIAGIVGGFTMLERKMIGLKQIGMMLSPKFSSINGGEKFEQFVRLQEKLDSMPTSRGKTEDIMDWYYAIKKTGDGAEGAAGGVEKLNESVSLGTGLTDSFTKKLSDLDFQTRLAKGQFDGFATGAAEAAYSLGILRDITVDHSKGIGNMTFEQGKLNAAMLKYNIAVFEANPPLNEFMETGKKVGNVGEEIGRSFQGGMSTMISSLARGKGALGSFADFAKRMLEQVAQALLNAGMEGFFASRDGGGAGGGGTRPVDALVGGGTIDKSSKIGGGDTYYMIDARGSESEQILEMKMESILQKHEPNIIRKSVQSAKEDRLRDVGN